MNRAKITGIGFHVPERVVTNQDLEKIMNTSDEWIKERDEYLSKKFGLL